MKRVPIQEASLVSVYIGLSDLWSDPTTFVELCLAAKVHLDPFVRLCMFNVYKGLQGRSQDFLKGGSSTSIELLEAGVWGHSPQPLRDFQYFNKSKLSKLLYFMQKVH